jgi:hypothetical protein
VSLAGRAFIHGTRHAQDPPLVDEFRQIDLTTTRPPGLHPSSHDHLIVEKNFSIEGSIQLMPPIMISTSNSLRAGDALLGHYCERP